MRQRGQIEAEREGPEGSKKSEGRGFARDTLLPILAVVAILVPLRSAIADWNDVPSGSMRPTILEGDRIWVNKLAYGLRVPLTMAWIAHWDEPTRGDVVTLASPDDGIRLVKRIVGLPGDRITMTANRLMINGEPVPYQVAALRGLKSIKEFDSIKDGTLGKWLSEVIITESPVHIEEVCQRVLDATSVSRMGRRIKERFLSSIKTLVWFNSFEAVGDTIWSDSDKKLKVRDRSSAKEVSKPVTFGAFS